MMFPKFGFYFSRRMVAEALVQAWFVPPIHPLERRDFHVDHIVPSAGMNQFVVSLAHTIA
nr:hypothetical protein [Corynebacterium belfantii]